MFLAASISDFALNDSDHDSFTGEVQTILVEISWKEREIVWLGSEDSYQKDDS